MITVFLTVPQCRTDKIYIVVLSGSQCFDCYCMLVFTKQQNKLTLSLLIQYCQKVSDPIPSEARRKALRFARCITSSRAKRGDRAWSQRRANLASPSIYIVFEYIYRSFPVGIRIQCDVSQYMHSRFALQSTSRPDFYLLSVKEIFRLSVNHEQIPSIPMTHKSKHYNPGFKTWMQILAGENSSGASTKRRIEIQRQQQRRRRQRKTPQQREHRFSFAQRRRSRQQETEKTRERLWRVEYVYRQLL